MQFLESVAELKNADITIGDKTVLKGVQFSIAPAEFCYVVGKTGSGKTSLLKTLYGELPLTIGEGNVAGTSLNNLPKGKVPALRRKLGMVFQGFELFNDWTVEQNFGFVLQATGWKEKEKRSERIEEVLAAVNLTNKRKEKVYNLSGGEKQRIAMGRAILNRPKLIIADEPTGHLDTETAEDILHLLRELAIMHKTSVVISTHNYELIEKFPARVYECKEERLIERN